MTKPASKYWIGPFTSLQRMLRWSFLPGGLFLWVVRHGPVPVVVVSLGLLLSALATFLPGRATVGADGLLLRWLFLRRFVPFTIMEHVAVQSMVSRNKDGSPNVSGYRVEIETSEGPDVNVDTGRNPRELFDVLVAARRSRHVREHGAFDPRALRAEGDDEKAWLGRLRALADRVQSFRVDAPSTEELLAIVDDATLDEEARAGAAVVLGARSDDEAKARLRVAKEATASPKLRVVLDAAADGQEEDVERALTDIGGEARKAAR